MRVRSFYLDLEEWALEDPSGVPWAVPSPVRGGDTEGSLKARKATTAEMHQRTRERLPHLPVLVHAAERHCIDMEHMLQAATDTSVNETFEHAGLSFRRIVRKSYARGGTQKGSSHITVEGLATGVIIDVTRVEDEAFWAWAIIETLRHTGVRIEELLEITHLALVSYRLPDTKEVVPLLQIVPSKSNEERLLLVTPELASVLASIITRLRGSQGHVPVTARYDPHEATNRNPRCPTCSNAIRDGATR